MDELFSQDLKSRLSELLDYIQRQNIPKDIEHFFTNISKCFRDSYDANFCNLCFSLHKDYQLCPFQPNRELKDRLTFCPIHKTASKVLVKGNIIQHCIRFHCKHGVPVTNGYVFQVLFYCCVIFPTNSQLVDCLSWYFVIRGNGDVSLINEEDLNALKKPFVETMERMFLENDMRSMIEQIIGYKPSVDLNQELKGRLSFWRETKSFGRGHKKFIFNINDLSEIEKASQEIINLEIRKSKYNSIDRFLVEKYNSVSSVGWLWNAHALQTYVSFRYYNKDKIIENLDIGPQGLDILDITDESLLVAKSNNSGPICLSDDEGDIAMEVSDNKIPKDKKKIESVSETKDKDEHLSPTEEEEEEEKEETKYSLSTKYPKPAYAPIDMNKVVSNATKSSDSHLSKKPFATKERKSPSKSLNSDDDLIIEKTKRKTKHKTKLSELGLTESERESSPTTSSKSLSVSGERDGLALEKKRGRTLKQDSESVESEEDDIIETSRVEEDGDITMEMSSSEPNPIKKVNKGKRDNNHVIIEDDDNLQFGNGFRSDDSQFHSKLENSIATKQRAPLSYRYNNILTNKSGSGHKSSNQSKYFTFKGRSEKLIEDHSSLLLNDDLLNPQKVVLPSNKRHVDEELPNQFRTPKSKNHNLASIPIRDLTLESPKARKRQKTDIDIADTSTVSFSDTATDTDTDANDDDIIMSDSRTIFSSTNRPKRKNKNKNTITRIDQIKFSGKNNRHATRLNEKEDEDEDENDVIIIQDEKFIPHSTINSKSITTMDEVKNSFSKTKLLRPEVEETILVDSESEDDEDYEEHEVDLSENGYDEDFNPVPYLKSIYSGKDDMTFENLINLINFTLSKIPNPNVKVINSSITSTLKRDTYFIYPYSIQNTMSILFGDIKLDKNNTDTKVSLAFMGPVNVKPLILDKIKTLKLGNVVFKDMKIGLMKKYPVNNPTALFLTFYKLLVVLNKGKGDIDEYPLAGILTQITKDLKTRDLKDCIKDYILRIS